MESKVNILRCEWKGERNAMFIVALYLVIKEHKICLWFFFYVNTPWYFSLSIFCYGSGGSCNFSTCIPFHLTLFFPLFLLFTLIPTSVFAPPFRFSVSFCFSVCLSVSLWVLCQLNMDTNLGDYFGFHKCGQILAEAKQLHDVALEQTKHFPVFVTIL